MPHRYRSSRTMCGARLRRSGRPLRVSFSRRSPELKTVQNVLLTLNQVLLRPFPWRGPLSFVSYPPLPGSERVPHHSGYTPVRPGTSSRGLSVRPLHRAGGPSPEKLLSYLKPETRHSMFPGVTFKNSSPHRTGRGTVCFRSTTKVRVALSSKEVLLVSLHDGYSPAPHTYFLLPTHTQVLVEKT